VRVYRGNGGSGSNSGRVVFLGLLLLLFLVLLALHAMGRFVGSPHHVVLTPVVSVLPNLFLLLFIVCWWLFHPRLILLLFTLIECVLLVFLLPALVAALFVSIVCNGAEHGIQLKLALESVESSGHCQNFLVVRRFGSQIPLVLSQSNLHLAEVIKASWVLLLSLHQGSPCTGIEYTT
jgi:hypothetical protein